MDALDKQVKSMSEERQRLVEQLSFLRVEIEKAQKQKGALAETKTKMLQDLQEMNSEIELKQKFLEENLQTLIDKLEQ